MELILDIGNSRVKAGLFEADRLHAAASFMHADVAGLEEFLKGTDLRTAAYGSVAGAAVPLLRWVEQRVEVQRISADGPAPVRSDYQTGTTLGVDRLANVVAAGALFTGRPVLTIGMGTCIIVDLIDAEGVYRGGSISPGLHMRARAMNDYSAALPLVEPGPTASIWGLSTQGSLKSGIWHGTLGELEHAISAARAIHAGLVVVLTGGGALEPVRALKSGIFAHPFLTLEGLRLILRHRAGLAPAGPGTGASAAG